MSGGTWTMSWSGGRPIITLQGDEAALRMLHDVAPRLGEVNSQYESGDGPLRMSAISYAPKVKKGRP